MKLRPTLVVCLLIVAILVSCITVDAQPQLFPHEDPSSAQSTLDSYSCLIQYVQVFGLMSAQDFSNASQLSQELAHITVPSSLAYIVNRYNNLTQQLISTLSDLQSTLNDASSLLDQYRLTEAEQALNHAGVLVSQAQILLSELQDATSSLSKQLGVSTASSRVTQAYDQLQAMLNELNNLINKFHELLTEANARAQEIEDENLTSTMLSLSLNTTSCFVGGYVSVSGALTTNSSQGLQNRMVEVLLDGSQVATANTQSDGSYHTTIQIPYEYVSSMSVSALYNPAGNDKGVYLASSSPTVTLQILFYDTVLNVSVSDTAHPGLSLSIKGNVTSTNQTPLNDRSVKVMLDDITVAQVTTNQSGVFSTVLAIASNATLGAHTLTVDVSSSGLYAGTTVQRTLTIDKIVTTVKINTPSFVVLPSQMYISGTVSSPTGPLKNTTVLIQLANMGTNVSTLSDGSFNITINAPLTSFLTGYQTLNVTAEPSEPWQATGQTKVNIFVLNSVSIGATVASSLSVIFVANFKFTQTKKRSKKEQSGTVKASSGPTVLKNGVAGVAAKASSPQLNFVGDRGVVLKAYTDALRSFEAATGDSLKPDMTLREFLQKTGAKIGEASDQFSKITLLAEKSLYSRHEPQAEDLETAKTLASEIRRILSAST